MGGPADHFVVFIDNGEIGTIGLLPFRRRWKGENRQQEKNRRQPGYTFFLHFSHPSPSPRACSSAGPSWIRSLVSPIISASKTPMIPARTRVSKIPAPPIR